MNNNGQQMGVMPLGEALELADQAELDLVEVSPEARPPVCKIFDYSKFKFEQSKREKEVRKRQHTVHVKEIKFRPKIDQHDYATKRGHVMRFIKAQSKVKVTIMYRGREMDHLERGRRILDQLVTDLKDYVVVETMPKVEWRNMVMMISPKKPDKSVSTDKGGARGGATAARAPERK